MPTLNYQFSHHEVTMIRLALGVVLRQFENCRDGEAPQMLAYINAAIMVGGQPSGAYDDRTTLGSGGVVTINAPVPCFHRLWGG